MNESSLLFLSNPALSLAKKSVNPIDKAHEHKMSINMNSLTWREYQMRLIQYQGMVHSRNDGTSFNVLGIDGCVTPTQESSSPFLRFFMISIIYIFDKVQ